MYVIEATDVCKNYGNKEALKNVNLQIKDSIVYALLGPNGAGKTTFLKSVLSLTCISSGSIQLNGRSVQDRDSRRGVAFLPESFYFFPYYTVEGVVTFYGRMAGFKGQELKRRITNSLERIKMEEHRKLKVKSLSKGMLQRTGIACMLVGDNQLFLLDEPFSGLDPLGIKELKDIIQDIKNQGKTVFINSHILSEMEKIGDEIAILNKGTVMAVGMLKDLVGDRSLEDYFYEKVGREL